jgi:uncharacterized protein (DUF1684 family)
MTSDNYIDEITRLRLERHRRIISNPLNWFTLIGLFPLAQEENTFGNFADARIQLDLLSEGRCGSFRFENDKVSLHPEKGSSITVNGKPPEPCALRADVDGDPDLTECGRLALRVIRRGDRFFLRVWDKESPVMKNFPGLNYYPVKPDYCILAEYICFDLPRIIKILDMTGNEHESVFPGEARFILAGKSYTLVAEDDGDDLLFSFTDKTREDTTYPGGRYLTAPKPENDRVTLDFNLAVNWPCAYTPYATCPLPPMENRLSVRIEAGEMKYQK